MISLIKNLCISVSQSGINMCCSL